MKLIQFTIALLFISFTFVSTTNAQNLDSLQNQIMKLMKYYESYDNSSADSLKKAKFKAAIKEITDGTATQHEVDASFKIVDWYVKGDKAVGKDDGKPHPIPEDFDEFIENTDEAKAAINYLNQQKGMLQKISYSEFEECCEKASPVANKNDIKKAFNELHKSDGKQVSISSEDEKMTEAQKQMWAFYILNNPKTYGDFKKACKILDTNIPDSKIKNAWAQKKQIVKTFE